MARTGAVWVLAAALGVGAVTAQESKPTFEVASVKLRSGRFGLTMRVTPQTFYRDGITVVGLIRFAYNLPLPQVVGGPEWMRQQPYEVIAKSAGDASPEQMRLMVRSLLEDRFKLLARVEQRNVRHQALRLHRADGRLGSKLERCDPANPPAANSKPIAIPYRAFPLPLAGSCAPLASMADFLSTILSMPVLDRTGLQGTWNFRVWFADPSSPLRSEVPSLATALQEELGLKLDAAEGPVDVLVIDSVQQPTEN